MKVSSILLVWTACLLTPSPASANESPFLYGIHDHDTNPQPFLDRIVAGGATGWVTATVAIGSDPNNRGGDDFSSIANQGHTVIVRLNNGYCPDGTIPPPSKYADFARRAANYVAASRGANIWVIGNETNLPWEWPAVNGHAAYVSPQNYASLFRLVYDEIKKVRPDANVIPQALAPFAGPLSAGSTCGVTHDALPLNWVQYMKAMLTAIKATGPLDGIAVHLTSRGYTYDAIHSTQKVNAAGQDLYFSFYVYKDWVNLGIPQELYHLPLYATESNGYYYWSGGHPENPNAHYEPGWVQEVYAEIDRYNQEAAATGKPIFRCLNLYRWCAWCDGWNIDGSPYQGQILSDLDVAVAAQYRWPGAAPPDVPPGENIARRAVNWLASSSFSSDFGGNKAYDGVITASSKWTSNGTTVESWLALDLGASYDLSGFIVRHAGAAGELTGFNTQAYRLESGSSLSGPWTTLATINNAAQENSTTTLLPSTVATRFVRLYITDAGIDNYARIPEFEVYGSSSSSGANLITNGGFDSGVNGWPVWIERGTLNPTVSNGQLHLQSSNHNGGVYQQFATGGAGAEISMDGFWASDPTVGQNQWAEVLVINGSRLPVNGQDIRADQSDVVLVYKNDTWASPGGWSGSMELTAPVAKVGSLVAQGNVATLVLKSGNMGGQTTGTRFDDIIVRVTAPPPSNRPPTAAASASPTTGTVPLTVSFDGTDSSDLDGDPLSYSWSFGDGTEGSGAVVSHTYQSQGTFLATLTVSDGRGGSASDTVAVSVGGGPPPLPPYCPSTLDFAAIRAQLNQQGQDLAFVRIGFHVGPGGNQTGLGDWMRCLDAAGVPFFLKSADSAGQVLEGVQLKAASGVPHVLVYRRSGAEYDTPSYNLPPYDAAVVHWQRHRAVFPPELEPYKHLIWLETINEVDKNRAEWLAEFAYHTAQFAMAEGFNWAAFSWSTGEPEPEHWEGPWMQTFLELAGNNPDRVAVALHEYSLVQDNLDRWYPFLVGRFQRLFEICDNFGIPRPTVLITEFGWGPTDIADTIEQAMEIDIPWAAELYADFPEVEGAAIWYLGPGYGRIANEAQKLIAPMTEYALQNYFVIPLEPDRR